MPAAGKICQLRNKWSLAGFWQVIHWVNNNKQFLGYAHMIIQYLSNIEMSTCKWKVWNKFLTTLSIVATVTSKVIGQEENLVLSTCSLVNMKLGSPTFKVLQKIQLCLDEICSRFLAKNGDWLNENLNQETFFLKLQPCLSHIGLNTDFTHKIVC